MSPNPRNEETRVAPLAVGRREAAKALGISERTLWSLTTDATSGIPHFRIGKRVLYPIDELRAWTSARAQRRGERT